jgi:hypothetical protein
MLGNGPYDGKRNQESECYRHESIIYYFEHKDQYIYIEWISIIIKVKKLEL